MATIDNTRRLALELETAQAANPVVPAAVDAAQLALDTAVAAANATAAGEQHGSPMRELCSGRIAQNPILVSGRLDPEAVFGPWPGNGDRFPDAYYECPPNVPLFTTMAVIERAGDVAGGLRFNQNGKRARDMGDQEIIPVTAHIPSAARLASFVGASRLVFVGVSYNAASKNKLVTVSVGGQIAVPHAAQDAQGAPTFETLIGSRVWWQRAVGPYGGPHALTIAVPEARNAQQIADDPIFEDPATATVAKIVVQHADMTDCAVLLGATTR